MLEYTDLPLVSADIVQNPASCIFSALDTMANGKMVKVLGWYDNEWGYSNRLDRSRRVRRLQVAAGAVRWSTRFRNSRISALERGTRVLLRADFNVPLHDGRDRRRPAHHRRAADDRVPARRGARRSCAARTSGGRRARSTRSTRSRRSPRRLSELLGTTVGLSPEVAGFESVRRSQCLEPGDVMLIENLRFDPGEEANDPAFAANLTELADVYVDDAFGAAHRAHASIVGPPLVLPSAAGRLLAREVEVLGGLLDEPKQPFVAILGGVKVSDKLGVLDALLERCDTLLIGGAMAFTFLAAQGAHVGDSLVQADQVDALPRAAEDRAASRSRPTSSPRPR